MVLRAGPLLQHRARGGTTGWRAPSVVELLSLMDPSLPPPFVPSAVFNGVQVGQQYWTTTERVDNREYGYAVMTWQYGANPFPKYDPGFMWCVRGHE